MKLQLQSAVFPGVTFLGVKK